MPVGRVSLKYMPNLPEVIAPLRPYLKKGAKFSDYLNDSVAKQARIDLKMVIAHCVLVAPDYEAAGKPELGRLFELFVDATDYGWCAILTQRDRPGSTPRILAVVVRSSTGARVKWTTFERESFGYSKGLQRVEHLIKASPASRGRIIKIIPL